MSQNFIAYNIPDSQIIFEQYNQINSYLANTKYFHLGKNLNQRDTIAVRKLVGGLLKLIYPDGVFEKQDVEEILKIALEMRRRVKEQLKKLGGMEFYDVNFSYIDNESFDEHYVTAYSCSCRESIKKFPLGNIFLDF